MARGGQLVCLAGGEPWQVSAAADSLFLLIVGRLPEPAAESPVSRPETCRSNVHLSIPPSAVAFLRVELLARRTEPRAGAPQERHRTHGDRGEPEHGSERSERDPEADRERRQRRSREASLLVQERPVDGFGCSGLRSARRRSRCERISQTDKVPVASARPASRTVPATS